MFKGSFGFFKRGSRSFWDPDIVASMIRLCHRG